MKYTIYRGSEVVVADVEIQGSVTEKIMGEETASLTFSAYEKIEFHIGDKITIFGRDYFLSTEPVTEKINSRLFNYTLVFFSLKYILSDIQLFFYDNDNELTIPDFDIMGNASTCLDAIIANVNRIDSGWTKGDVDETEVKLISFSSVNCLEAVSKIADEFELEYWIDSDKSIHFTERKPVSGYSFSYGQSQGLKNIKRSILEGGSLCTRLYVKGSTQNLPKNYRSGQKNLRIDVPYLEKNTSIYGVKEHTETFDIFPKYEGTVTAISETDFNIFSDANLDFDLNAYNEYGTTVLKAGVTAKIIFQTGQLAGYTIELLEAGGFNSATKTFYLNRVKDEADIVVPSELLRPAIGDKYIIVDIMMPEAYVLAAETLLKTKAQEYLDKNSKERFQYNVVSDPFYFEAQNVNIPLGSTVHFIDSDFGLDDDIRVIGKKTNVQDQYSVELELSEETQVSSIVKSYYEQQKTQNTIINNLKYNAEQARRNYLFGREFHDKVFDGEDYFKAENIKPLSIETKMLSLGSRLQQFGLPGVSFKIENNNTLINTSGKIVHQTINPDAVREWNIAAKSVTGISNNFNYIFIKCQKVGTNASFVVSETPIKVEADADFYHFEVGYLSSILEGYRKIKTTYGFAQLNPAELSIGRIADPSGNNFIELKEDGIDISAKVIFKSGSSGYENLTDKPDLSSFEQTRDYVNSTLQTDLNDLKNRADGVIESWFYSHTPTLSNLPASNWVTTEERNAHIGDTFTNMQEFVDNVNTPDAGKAWRFVKNETTGVFSWSLIANSDSTKALVEAGKAKDTADAKRRVFVSQPYPPYNIGDLWVQGNGGDIMRCKFERLSGSYVATDFEKASKYTDDTAVNNLQIGGRNLILNSDSNDIIMLYGVTATYENVIDNQLPSKQYFKFTNVVRTIGNYVFYIPTNNPDKFSQSLIGKKIQISFHIRSNNSQKLIFEKDINQNFIIDSTWKKVSFNTIFNDGNLHFLLEGSSLTSFDISSVKLEFGDKATDWTPAPEDLDNAISTAQTSANTANSLLADIANDNVLSPSEKQSTKKEWDIIASEKTTVETQATSLGVSATLYNSAYNSLNTYITPLLADLTTNSTIDGATFRAKFKAYYDAKISLLKDVTDKLKANTDNIQIGGRNLLLGSAFNDLSKFGVNVNVSIDTSNKILGNNSVKSIQSGLANDDWRGVWSSNIAVNNGEEFTLTVHSYTDNLSSFDNSAICEVIPFDSAGNRLFLNVITLDIKPTQNGKWEKKTISGKIQNANVSYIRITPYVTRNGRLWFGGIKFERGNKATDWSPAPEDVQQQIDDITSDSVLTPSEKLQVKQQIDEVVKKRINYEALYAKYNSIINTTIWSNYASWYDWITKSGGYVYGVAFDNPNGNTQINSSTFRSEWQNYFDAESKLLTEFERCGIANIKVGGRNLIVNYDGGGIIKLHGVSGTKTIVTDSTLPSKSLIRFSNIQREIGNYVFYIHLLGNTENIKEPLVGKEINVSFYARANNSQRMYFDRNANISVNLDTTWKKMSFPWVYDFGNFHLLLEGSGLTTLEIHSVKIEYGNKGTDWSPSPEDVDNKITAEAQKIIALENKTNFLGGTTIDGNVVATGTMLVGNADGTNAGLTGTGNTNDGVYLWGGGTYQQMIQGLAKKEQRRNGVDIWRHPNGQIGFEIGIKDGRLIFNGYHSDGYKLFELDPNRGLIAVLYTQESWTQTPLRKLNYTSSTFDEQTIANELKLAITKNNTYTQFTAPGEMATPDTEYSYLTTYTLLENYVGYDYDNGTNPTNAVYENLKGMKANSGDRNTNIPNGWYLPQVGLIYSESSFNSYPPRYYTFVVYVYYYTNGKITDTRVVTITK